MSNYCFHISNQSLLVITPGHQWAQNMQRNGGMTFAKTLQFVSIDPEQSGKILSTKKKDFQLAAFTGLFVLFLLMVVVLFRRHRNRKRGYVRVSPDKLSGNLWRADNLTFTPSIFATDSSPTILVAHHDNDQRLFIINTLRLNYRVLGTTNGEEAFNKAFEMVPDLIITDRSLAGIDGPLLYRKIKSTDVTSHIPVIVLNSSPDALFLPETVHVADDSLQKNFDARELLMKVHTLIQGRNKFQEEFLKKILREGSIVQRHEDPFVHKLLALLTTYYGDPLFGVEQLTDQLQMSRLQLYRKLKALTKYSPGEFIRQFRLEQAKNFLIKDDLTVSDIAYKTGFSNLNNFSRLFKNYTGQSPTEFSRRYKTSDQFLVDEE